MRTPAPLAAERLARMPLSFALRRPQLLAAAWLIALVGATLGTLGVLVPLRLAAGGASGLEVGLTFVIASALAAAPLVGALGDRRGPLTPVRASLAILAPCLLALALVHSSLLVALLTILAVAAAAGGCIGPCVAFTATAAERASISLAAATATLNLAFALGESVGATGGPSLTQASSETLTLLILFCAVALTAAVLIAPRARGGATAPVAGGVGDQVP